MIGKKIPVDPKKAAGRSKANNIGDLTDYIVDPKSTGSDEKVLYAGARGFITDTHRGRQAEMIALAMEAVRSAAPVTHWVLSWREGEIPTSAQVEEAVSIFLNEQGLSEHQAIYALHQDTDNIHLHIAVNRVHPDELKMVKANGGFDREATSRAVARIEHVQGWKSEKKARYMVLPNGMLAQTNPIGDAMPDPGWSAVQALQKKHVEERKKLYVNQVGTAIEEQKAERKTVRERQKMEHVAMRGLLPPSRANDDAAPSISTKARDGENRTGEKSAERTAVDVAGPILRAATSWGQLHRNLAAFGCRFEKKGSGAVVFIGDVPVKAAKVCRKSSMGKLEKRLGAYEPAPVGLELAQRQPEPVKADTPRWDEYQGAKRQHEDERKREQAAIKQRHEAEWRDVRDRHRARREELLTGDWRGKGAAKNAISSVAKAEQARNEAELKERHRREKETLKKRLPRFPKIEDWYLTQERPDLVEQWRYRNNTESMLFGAGDESPLPRARDIRSFTAQILGGHVLYQRADAAAPAFVDFGKRIDITSWLDRDATLAALQLAAKKWGTITVSGCPEYQQMIVELAAEHGFKINNPELQESIAAERQQRRPKVDWSQFRTSAASSGRPVRAPEVQSEAKHDWSRFKTLAGGGTSQPVAVVAIDREVISLQVEFQRRVDALPSAEGHLVGPAYTIAAHSLDAIRATGGDAGKVDWPAVERASALESLSYGQSPQDVIDALLQHSPGAASAKRQAELRVMVEELVVTPSPAVEDKPTHIQTEDHERDRDDDAGPGW
ncbi:TraI/MobA(P) family conjugative relaxase [Janthinobacterium sp. CG_23.4]|uniref:TraI/MobA(P) family conjugative relaxase n=1 Tax=Janthinobacterium sp. CG_23.4 TaxID=2760707 RepID=UPI00247519C0|nr:TraI/MobA(P) family conjugative relaxase [Janthinobacterium sp. CG_23.4]MDH6160324.1 hypothetical protein [Janthinobacterium sp. CG_23.4]